ncbi:Uu.00g012810.m01.CDS01 [Anthostomella pinea]|uniref:Uu.00g012810.m01.CDS01 n=1 Tax=Anthostomella pinea TaxID=933095 RepID=A0AAI8VY13_9PEZI|nr:Uu.00g012810.m01.CDS01 [Anthostomella pinea]
MSNSVLAPLRAMILSTSLVISVCVVDSIIIAYDSSLMGSLSVLGCYTSYFGITTTTKAVNSAATCIGAVLLVLFSGRLIDAGSRELGIVISALLNIFGAVLGCASQYIAMTSGRRRFGADIGGHVCWRDYESDRPPF